MRRPESYKELGISSDFMFAKVMRKPELCRKLLEVILGEKIERIEYMEEQKQIDILQDARSVRLDVYVEDKKGVVYNIEMQAAAPRNLPKRSRYYQGMIDMHLIEKGENFNKLRKSYVIFICTQDVFGAGRHIYTFENRCIEDPEIRLGDDTGKIFLNPQSEMDDIDEELGNFLAYVAGGEPSDEFTQMLDREIRLARQNREWEVEYMTLHMIEQEKFAEGVEQGIQQGIQQGEAMMSKLITYLLSKGMTEEAKQAALDENARKEMYRKYNIIE